MTRHRIDISTRLTEADFQVGEPRIIEDPDAALLAAAGASEIPKKRVPPDPYLPSPKLVEALNLSIALGRPLLLQGDPGCGKTRLAYAAAWALRLPLQIAVIKSTSRAQHLLYTYDAVSRLYDAQLGDKAPRDAEGRPRSERVESYIRLGPLGKAIARAEQGRRSVVLLDEIDKADLDFPNDLLWELDRLEFEVSEAPGMHFAVGEDRPELRPIVIVTHNDEKALPAAFLRRCVYHFIEFDHTEETLRAILSVHQIAEGVLAGKAIEVVRRLRALDLTKKPGLSELIDWAGYLEAVKASPEELEKLPYLGVLLKQESDQQSARDAFAKVAVKPGSRDT
jgi:MoxR-like ATPase